MGDSHYKSNIRSFDGTQVITGFNRIATVNSITATDITANGSVTGANLAGTNYIRVGTKKIIFPTAYSTAASINAEATALAAAYSFAASCVKGSLALGAGELWVFTADNSATMCTIP